MTRFTLFALPLLALALVSCSQNAPVEKDPEGTIYYTESDSIFANPERGFHSQTYYQSSDLSKVASAELFRRNRQGDYHLTLYLHSYYLTDYMESDIPQEFLDRLEQNMLALREGGAKCIIRFSYKSSYKNSDKPWDATPEWISRHIDQLTPYLQKYSDVIFCMQAGFIGSWGEWYYTSTFPFNPSKDEDFELRWELIDHLMDALPSDRQIALRTPGYKMRYLRMHGLDETPLTAEEAYKPTTKARLAGHNDCFVASANDVGTYFSPDERTFWAEDTKYTAMGGETCGECMFSTGENAVSEMATYHWTYINKDYHQGVLNSWITDQHMDEIKRRLGYRFVLDKAYMTQSPKSDSTFTATLTLHNVGFAAPVNKRDVELVFMSTSDSTKRFVYPQSDVDPRFWMADDTVKFTMSCRLDPAMVGEYNVYLNLPDPYATLHDNPLFSIRLANVGVWDEKYGYNRLATLNIR